LRRVPACLALQAEVEAYIEQFAGDRGEDGKRLVVRNGSAQPRTIVTGAGAIEITVLPDADARKLGGHGVALRFDGDAAQNWASASCGEDS
jgi:hypothetical protein